MKQLLLFTICLTTSSTWAFPTFGGCPPGGSAANFQILKKVAVMGSDERMTYEDYARAKKMPLEVIEKKFAATGSLVCAGIRSSAQLTGQDNVITTAGHAFHRLDCRPLDDFETCYYIHNPGPTESYFELDTSSVMFGGCEETAKDWGVAKLKKRVKGVKLYFVPEKPIDFQPGMDVTMTAGSHSDFKRGDLRPKTLTDCKIRDVTLSTSDPLRTDCDSGKNSSGGAQLIETERGLEVIAVNVGRPRNTFDKPPPGTPYDRDKYYNVAVPLTGDFLNAVRDTIAKAK